MSDQIIKSFLVRLGVVEDTSALARFKDSIENISKSVFRLAAAVEGAAFAVAIGVSKFANNLENLYFASQRTNTSANNIKAFQRTIQDFGGSAEGAMSSIEGFASYLRNNYGASSVVNGWLASVHKSLTGDQAKDISALGELFEKNTKEGNAPLNAMLASQFHIDEKTMLAIQNPAARAEMAKQIALANSADFNKASKDAHTFMMSLRELGRQLETFGTQVLDAIQVKFGVSIESITELIRQNGPEISKHLIQIAQDLIGQFTTIIKWLTANGPLITKRISEIFDSVSHAIETTKPYVTWVLDKFVELDKATDGWSTKILLLTLALKAMGATGLITGIFSLTGAFVKLGASIVGAAGAAAGLGGAAEGGGLLAALGLGGAAATGAVVAGTVGTGLGLGWLIEKMFPGVADFGNKLGGHLYHLMHQDEDAIRTLMDSGLTQQQAIGVTANLKQESGINPLQYGDNGAAYGIGQWHADRRAEYEKMFGHTMESVQDYDQAYREQFQFLRNEPGAQKMWSVWKANRNNMDIDADIYAQDFSRRYERPGSNPAERDAEARNRGQLAHNISTQVTIHVDGSRGDAHDTAKTISTHLKSIMRNGVAQAGGY